MTTPPAGPGLLAIGQHVAVLDALLDADIALAEERLIGARGRSRPLAPGRSRR